MRNFIGDRLETYIFTPPKPKAPKQSLAKRALNLYLGK